jgi:hypothetical protein
MRSRPVSCEDLFNEGIGCRRTRKSISSVVIANPMDDPICRRAPSIAGGALISFVCAHGDAFEFLQLAKEILDRVAALVEFRVDRQRRGAPWMLRDDDLGAALVEVGDDGIAVKGETVDERSNAHRIETMAGQENEADEIAQCVGQRQNCGLYRALRDSNKQRRDGDLMWHTQAAGKSFRTRQRASQSRRGTIREC